MARRSDRHLCDALAGVVVERHGNGRLVGAQQLQPHRRRRQGVATVQRQLTGWHLHTHTPPDKASHFNALARGGGGERVAGGSTVERSGDVGPTRRAHLVLVAAVLLQLGLVIGEPQLHTHTHTHRRRHSAPPTRPLMTPQRIGPPTWNLTSWSPRAAAVGSSSDWGSIRCHPGQHASAHPRQPTLRGISG
jgi:hypothetical protein